MNKEFRPTISFGIDKQCPVCKKMFIVYDSYAHAFKITKNGTHVPVCSWGCLRRYEQKHERKHEARRRALIEKQLQGIQEGY